MAEKTVFKKLQEVFLCDVFGVTPCPLIRRIKPGNVGDFEVKDTIDADNGWIYQQLIRNGTLLTDNHPNRLKKAHKKFLTQTTGRILINCLGLGDSLNAVMDNVKRTIRKGFRFNKKEWEALELARKLSGKKLSEIVIRGSIKEALRIANVDESQINAMIDKMAG